MQFRPGKANGKADALTHRSGDLPCDGDVRGRPIQSILDPTQLLNFPDPEPEPVPTPIPSTQLINGAILCKAAVNHNLEIQTALVEDKFANAVVDAIKAGSKKLTGKYSKSISLGECKFDSQTGLMHVYGLLYVPNNESLYQTIIHAHHDHPAAGHPGRAATYELVSYNYWWPGMRKTIARYLANYDTCARIKPGRHTTYGLLKPLQVPVVRWSSVSTDFITELPES